MGSSRSGSSASEALRREERAPTSTPLCYQRSREKEKKGGAKAARRRRRLEKRSGCGCGPASGQFLPPSLRRPRGGRKGEEERSGEGWNGRPLPPYQPFPFLMGCLLFLLLQFGCLSGPGRARCHKGHETLLSWPLFLLGGLHPSRSSLLPPFSWPLRAHTPSSGCGGGGG